MNAIINTTALAEAPRQVHEPATIIELASLYDLYRNLQECVASALNEPRARRLDKVMERLENQFIERAEDVAERMRRHPNVGIWGETRDEYLMRHAIWKGASPSEMIALASALASGVRQ